MNLGGGEGFGQAQCGHAVGEHGFAGAGRADHQQVVTSGGGDFECALGVVLAADLREVDRVVRVAFEQFLDV